MAVGGNHDDDDSGWADARTSLPPPPARGAVDDEFSEIDLREIALRGYADAASTDRKAEAEAVAIFVSDQCFGLRQGSVAA
jgi:hypothetical protein